MGSVPGEQDQSPNCTWLVLSMQVKSDCPFCTWLHREIPCAAASYGMDGIMGAGTCGTFRAVCQGIAKDAMTCSPSCIEGQCCVLTLCPRGLVHVALWQL